jgi:hypothetical protein
MHIFEISEEVHPYIDHDTTLDFGNAFLSPSVNSREELVPNVGLKIYLFVINFYSFLFITVKYSLEFLCNQTR